MRKSLTTILFALAVVLPNEITAQTLTKNSAYQNYINRYASMAHDQMLRHGIPASIILAQGLLESGAGQSMLATKANNHFGIKVTSDWTGDYILRDDDRPNEKFRVYHSAAESYEDHSRFLKRSRYQRLYNLSITDYKGWAQGLKDCGYATSPTYAANLINIIELYGLQNYDSSRMPGGGLEQELPAQSYVGNIATTAAHHIRGIQDIIRFCNGSRYIIAQPGETWELLSKYYGISARKLRNINEMPKNMQPAAGDVIYLDTKSSKAAKAFKKKYHVVKLGESVYTISQTYGMKMKTLYKLNKLTPDYTPRAGDHIRLR